MRSEAGQEDGQQDEAVEHSVADCQAKYLEKREEDVRGGETKVAFFYDITES